jgi:hypothetical protein
MASSNVRARPSCRKVAFGCATCVSPMPHSGGVRHSEAMPAYRHVNSTGSFLTKADKCGINLKQTKSMRKVEVATGAF